MRWIIVSTLVLVVVAAIVGGPSQLRDELAQFGGPFGYDDSGRFDAVMFLVSCLVLAPFAVLAVTLVAVPLVVLTLETVVFPVSRAAGISDGIAALVAIATGIVVVLMKTDIPVWAIQGLGTIARAWILITA